MILTGAKIAEEVMSNQIVIDPFDQKYCNPNSYNYHLGPLLVELDNQGEAQLPFEIPKDGYLLQPKRIYLGQTAERIGSSEYVVSLIGKSSMGRLGLFLQLSADIGHQNQIHQWTLELTCLKPFWIYPGMVIGQVTFWRTLGKPLIDTGKYSKFNAPTPRKD